MKIDLHTSSKPVAPVSPEAQLSAIFPEFGSNALDVPHYDSDKHMYIVDQHTSANGHRSITYVAVGRQLVVEVVLGLYHSFTLMNTVRLLIPNGTTLAVVKTHQWEGTTYFNMNTLRQKITEMASEYAMDNLGLSGSAVDEKVSMYAGALVADLMTQDVESQQKENGMAVLKAYCRQMQVCKDYVAF